MNSLAQSTYTDSPNMAKPSQPLLHEIHAELDYIFETAGILDQRIRQVIGAPTAVSGPSAPPQPTVPTLLGLRSRLSLLRAGLAQLNNEVQQL